MRMSIHDVIEGQGFPASHSTTVQHLLGMIRTELDRFSAEEAFVLYRHGYFSAQQQYAARINLGTKTNRNPWVPVTISSSNDDLSALPVEELEGRLQDSEVVRKPEIYGAKLRLWVMCWALRRFRKWLVLSLILLASAGILLFLSGYLAGRPAQPVSAVGTLEISEAVAYNNDGWAAKLPILVAALHSADPHYVYTLISEPIGSLNRNQPHTAGSATFKVAGEVSDSKIYLLLRQQSGGSGFLYVLLDQTGPRMLRVASGGPGDVICGVIVRNSRLDDPDKSIKNKNNVEIEMEKTP